MSEDRARLGAQDRRAHRHGAGPGRARRASPRPTPSASLRPPSASPRGAGRSAPPCPHAAHPGRRGARPTSAGASGRPSPRPPCSPHPPPPVSAAPRRHSAGQRGRRGDAHAHHHHQPGAGRGRGPARRRFPRRRTAPRLPYEDSWTPYQPTAQDGPSAPPPDPVAARAEMPSDDLIPIDTDVAEAPQRAEDAPVEAPPPSGEPIEPIEDHEAAIPTPPPPPPASRAPLPPAAPPPVRALSPTEPEGEEVKFDDDASRARDAGVGPHGAPPSRGRRRPPLRSRSRGRRRGRGRRGAPAPQAKLIANLPPMRPRLDSQPPLPPPPKKQTAPEARASAARHRASARRLHGPVSDTPGSRRKGRLWWEDLFNDDYLRACEKLTDEQIAREVDFVEDSLSIERGGTVLDLACGTGRHAIELSRRGYEVVGFDLSLAMLARAGDEAQDREAKLNFIQGDMREMTFDEQFDGVYCWNTSFGYFEEEKNAQVIDRIHRSLKRRGPAAARRGQPRLHHPPVPLARLVRGRRVRVHGRDERRLHHQPHEGQAHHHARRRPLARDRVLDARLQPARARDASCTSTASRCAR